MKALVLDAKWEPKPGYVVSEFEKTTGKAVTGNGVYKAPTLASGRSRSPRSAPRTSCSR